MFDSEAEMADQFLGVLQPRAAQRGVRMVDELHGVFGVPDYILVKLNQSLVEYVIAIELKLRDWRRALVQAFRYRSFAHESYVVIDEERGLQAALRQRPTFLRANIGLASMNVHRDLVVHISAMPRRPYSERQVSRMLEAVWEREQVDLEHAAPATRFQALGNDYTELSRFDRLIAVES